MKLEIELIPKSCHYSNVRTMIKPSEWNNLRKKSYEKANHKCEICDNIGSKQGFKHNLECHEIWEYDDINHIQRLVDLIALCPFCHLAKHIGRAIAMKKKDIIVKHMMVLNKVTKEEILTYIETALQTNRERSKHKWVLDISRLNLPPYNLNIGIDKDRVFKVKKIKRKRRKPQLKKRPIRKTKKGD